MRQIRPALLALVVVVLVATTVAAAANPSPAVETGTNATDDASDSTFAIIQGQPNATNFLDIEDEDVERGDHGQSSLDVGAAVNMDVERLRGQYESHAFDAAYANSSRDQQTARLRAEVDRLEKRIEELEERQQSAIRSYNAGRLSTDRFVQELATVDVAARQVDRQFQRIQNQPAVVVPGDLETRMTELETRLIPLRSPVRHRTGAAMRGEQPAVPVYALTSRRGLVLSTMDRGQFFREATLPANRDVGGEDNFLTDDDPTGVNTANDRARQLYPWTYANSPPSIERKASVYSVSLDHPHGTLDTYLDGATRDVFHEVQVLQADRLPSRSGVNTTSSVMLRVNRTYGTGPMKVTTLDPATRQPMDAVVVVNGERVGRTGEDGRVWTITPYRAVRLEIRVAAGAAELNFFAE